MATPVRTCVGCRSRRPQDELLRFVRPQEGRPIMGRRLHGRGWYICPTRHCAGKMEGRLRRWFSTKEIRSIRQAAMMMIEELEQRS